MNEVRVSTPLAPCLWSWRHVTAAARVSARSRHAGIIGTGPIDTYNREVSKFQCITKVLTAVEQIHQQEKHENKKNGDHSQSIDHTGMVLTAT